MPFRQDTPLLSPPSFVGDLPSSDIILKSELRVVQPQRPWTQGRDPNVLPGQWSLGPAVSCQVSGEGVRGSRSLLPREGGAYQQAVGAMDSDTARERVVDGQVPDVRGRVVASPLVHVACQVEVDRVLAHQLLAHVLQLDALQVGRLEPQRELGEESRESGGVREALPAPELMPTFQ